MKDTIRSAFNEVTMPQACEDHILAAMAQRKSAKARPHFARITAAAACLMAMVLLLTNPTVVSALENALSSALEKFVAVKEDKTIVEYQSADGVFSSGTTYNADGSWEGYGRFNCGLIPAWYKEQDDRVYFAGNGEWIDVTDLISMDTPFTYTYTDSNGIIHYICIGGIYDPDPEKSNVGYAEWYYDPNYTDPNGIQGHWAGGYCANYWDKDTDDDWPWLAKAKEEMGIPWK